jgi:hypothetical protein
MAAVTNRTMRTAEMTTRRIGNLLGKASALERL